MSELKSWVRENSTLVYFLIAQFVALGAGAASMLAYMVKLETRVSIMETRGAEYTVGRIGLMADRLTVMEQHVKKNEAQIDRLISEFLKDKPK